MSAHTVATNDPLAKVSVKTSHGTVHLPAHQAQNQVVPAMEIVKQYSATTTGSWSSYSEFSLTSDQLPHIVDTVTVAIALGAGSATASSYVALAGDANFLFKSIELYVGPTLISTLYDLNGYFQELAHYTCEAKFKNLTAAGNATLANRKTAGASAQVLYLNLPIPWLCKKTGWLSAQASTAFRIRLYHQDLSTVILTDGTAPAMPINSVTLDVAGRNFMSQASVGAHVANQRKLGVVSSRFLDPIAQQIVLPSGSSSYTFQLTNMLGNFSHMFFVIRLQSSVGTPLGNAQTAFLPCASYALNDSAGNIIVPTLPSLYATNVVLGRYVTGDMTDIAGVLGSTGTPKTVYPLIFSSNPEKALFDGSAHGYLRLDGLSKLTLNFASSQGAALVVDFVGYVQAQLNSDSTGAVSKVLVQ